MLPDMCPHATLKVSSCCYSGECSMRTQTYVSACCYSGECSMRTQIYVSAYAIYVSAFAVGGGQELFFISFHFFFFFSAECGFSHLDFEVAKAGPLLKKGGMLRYVAFFLFLFFFFPFFFSHSSRREACSGMQYE